MSFFLFPKRTEPLKTVEEQLNSSICERTCLSHLIFQCSPSDHLKFGGSLKKKNSSVLFKIIAVIWLSLVTCLLQWILVVSEGRKLVIWFWNMVTAAVCFSQNKTAMLCKEELLPSSHNWAAAFSPAGSTAVCATALWAGQGAENWAS